MSGISCEVQPFVPPSAEGSPLRAGIARILPRQLVQHLFVETYVDGRVEVRLGGYEFAVHHHVGKMLDALDVGIARLVEVLRVVAAPE